MRSIQDKLNCSQLQQLYEEQRAPVQSQQSIFSIKSDLKQQEK